MDLTGVKITDTRKFKTQNLPNDMKKIQYLNFGLNNKMPSCLCYTWTKSAYPHKYLFQVFQKFAVSNYDTFSELYQTCSTLIWMILRTPSKQKIFYTIMVLSLMIKIRDNKC